MKVAAALIALLAIFSIYQTQFAGEYFNKTEQTVVEMRQLDELEMYKQWRAEHKPSNSINDDIDYYRFYIWKQNLDFIRNYKDDQITLEMNKFADLTNEEFVSMYLGLAVGNAAEPKTIAISEQNDNVFVNWTQKGVVGEVLNQGQCGSCWSFSAAESLTSFTALKNGTIIYYSEQELVDCSGSFGNEGCNGGVVQWAYDYVLKNSIESSADYPYKGFQSRCKKDATQYKQYMPLTSYVEIDSGDCNHLAQAIQQQPVSIAIDASGLAFQLYKTGVYSNCRTSLNHAILLTGYSSQNGSGYWLALNSWGNGWGESGYIQFALGNTCGICQQATYPQ